MLLNSIYKYGWGNHKFEIIEECENSLMDEREIFWISELKSYCYDGDGMNMTKGGDGQRTTWKHDKRRIGIAKNRMMGENNPFYGKQHSEEMKSKLSGIAKERNKKNGINIPEWGVEKGRNIVRRPVVCYDLNGNFIREYISVTEAANSMNILPSCISANCSKRQTNASGYIFRYKNENQMPTKIDVGLIYNKTVKRPILWLSENLEVINEFESAKEAAKFFSIPKTTINRAACYNNFNPIRTGHIFCYKENYLDAYKIAS